MAPGHHSGLEMVSVASGFGVFSTMGRKTPRKPSRRRKKRKFLGNQFVRYEPVTSSSSSSEDGESNDEDIADPAYRTPYTAPRSASEKKLSDIPSWVFGSSSACESDYSRDVSSNPDSEESLSNDDDVDSEPSCTASTGNRLVSLEQLQGILSAVCVCRVCKSGDITISEDCSSREGLVSFVTMECSNPSCQSQGTYPLEKKVGRYFEMNRRSVLAMRRIGRGHAALTKFCGIMNMPGPVSRSNFSAHQKVLRCAALAVAERSMNEAAKEVHAVTTKAEPGIGEDDPADIAVTVDGTWMKRGFSSLYGVISSISWETGRIVDIEVLSKYCQECTTWNSRREKQLVTAEAFHEWQTAHKDVCRATTTCSSPAMESEGARAIWCRSEESRRLRYTTYIGDGDSKGYHAVTAAQPYGADVQVVKEECIGHVQKRLGTALRNLKKEKKGQKLSDGKTIGGLGRLSDKLIDTLQTYYGMAIRNNCGNLQAMAKAIWAGLQHRHSTDAEPRHEYCPPGGDSWCGYQRKLAGAQETYEHHNIMPDAIFEVVKPVYVRLSSKDLLRRCMRGATQNRNESYNGMVWALCPKEQFCGLEVVETAAALAVIHFNNGSVALLKVLTEMGCSLGEFTHRQLLSEDRMRVQKSNKKETESEKRSRKRRRRRRKGLEDQQKDVEGVTYAAGGFHD